MKLAFWMKVDLCCSSPSISLLVCALPWCSSRDIVGSRGDESSHNHSPYSTVENRRPCSRLRVASLSTTIRLGHSSSYGSNRIVLRSEEQSSKHRQTFQSTEFTIQCNINLVRCISFSICSSRYMLHWLSLKWGRHTAERDEAWQSHKLTSNGICGVVQGRLLPSTYCSSCRFIYCWPMMLESRCKIIRRTWKTAQSYILVEKILRTRWDICLSFYLQLNHTKVISFIRLIMHHDPVNSLHSQPALNAEAPVTNGGNGDRLACSWLPLL